MSSVARETATAPAPCFVSADTASRVLEWDAIVETLERAYGATQGPMSVPPRAVARDGEGIWLRSMSAIPAGSRYMGTKAFGLSRQQTLNYVITLFDQDTGAVAAFVDGNTVTARRTAGTSAVAVNRLAPGGPATLGVLGSGAEARAHVEAIASIRSIAAVRVFSPTEARRADFAASLSARLGIGVVAVGSPEAAVGDASIVVAAARARDEQPILFGQWLRPDALVVSIGSTLPEQREIDVSVVAASRLIVCDAVKEVCEETGDMLAARTAGLAFEHKIASLNDLVSGRIDRERTAAGLRLFKSVGTALQDIVVAALAYERARELGLALALPFSFLTKHA